MKQSWGDHDLVARLRAIGSRGVLALSLMILPGCFNKATIGVWAPSAASVPGHGRVALVGVAHDEAGRLAELLNARMGEFADWTVVSPEEIAPIQLVSKEAPISLEAVIDRASKSGIELLVSADVKEAHIERPATWKVIGGQPVARFTVHLVAFSPEDNSAIDSREISKTRKLSSDTTEISDNDYHALMTAAIDEFLGSLQPKCASVDMNLATAPMMTSGSRLVRIGNREAHRGRWTLAGEYYRRALATNPHNDAAMFNLAVVAIADRRFAEAEDMALQAQRLRPNPIYIEGFDKIKALAHDDALVRYQKGEAAE